MARFGQKCGENISLDIDGKTEGGIFVGVDEHFGMLLRSGSETRLVLLSKCLEAGEIS